MSNVLGDHQMRSIDIEDFYFSGITNLPLFDDILKENFRNYKQNIPVRYGPAFDKNRNLLKDDRGFYIFAAYFKKSQIEKMLENEKPSFEISLKEALAELDSEVNSMNKEMGCMKLEKLCN